MIKFKKGYSVKIISTILISVFLLANNVHSDAGYYLRKPLDFNHQNKVIIPRYEVAYEDVASIHSVDKSSRMERSLLFLAEKLSPVSFPLVLFSILNLFFSPLSNLDFTFCVRLFYLMAIPQLVQFFIFQTIMILPIRIPLIEPDFYTEYYNKMPIKRAEFILEKLRNKAKERNDEEILEVLAAVKNFMITKEWPIGGKVFDLPTGTLYVSAGMTEQPLQLQYMIMRRGNEMWRLGQFEYRKKPVYQYEIGRDTSGFLILHSKYIGIFLIYELCIILSDLSIERVLKLFGYDLLLPFSTIDSAIKVAKKRMTEEGKMYTPMDFAVEFNFSESLAMKLLNQIKGIDVTKEEKFVQNDGLGIMERVLNSADRNRRILIQGIRGFDATIREIVSLKKNRCNI